MAATNEAPDGMDAYINIGGSDAESDLRSEPGEQEGNKQTEPMDYETNKVTTVSNDEKNEIIKMMNHWK